MSRIRWMVFGLVAASLSGCGINTLRVESASQVASLADAVSDQAADILKQSQLRRQRAFVTLVASDPSCEPVNPIFILVPTTPAAAAKNVKLCADGSVETVPGYETVKLDFSVVDTSAIQPTLDLIAAVASYGEAMAKIVERRNADVGKEINEALSLAAKAKATADSIGVEGVPDIANLLSPDQTKTATKLMQFLADLEHERRQVKDIRNLFQKNDAKIKEVLGELRSQIGQWRSIIGNGAIETEIGNLQRVYRAERSSRGFDERMSLVTLVQEAKLSLRQSKAAGAGFDQAVDALAESQSELGRRLDGHLKPTERVEAAQISRDRIFKALSLVTKMLAAWKVF